MDFSPFFDELEKLGAISTQEARRSLDRLNSLEQVKPSGSQVARYGALGAGAGALTKTVGHVIEHGKLPGVRGALGSAAAGAIGMGAIPLIGQHFDRRAEYGKLKKFMGQQHDGEYGAAPGAMTDSPMTSGLSK